MRLLKHQKFLPWLAGLAIVIFIIALAMYYQKRIGDNNTSSEETETLNKVFPEQEEVVIPIK